MTLYLTPKQQKTFLWHWLALFLTPLMSHPQQVPCHCALSHTPQPIPVDRHHINICILNSKRNHCYTLVKIDNTPHPLGKGSPYSLYTS